MSNTTKRFAWKNRDTAANDLLQVVYHSPFSVRLKSLQLLKAFGSPTILSALKEIVTDETLNVWERRYALNAIASIPDEIYLPEIAKFAVLGGDLSFDDLWVLLGKHHSNLQWMFFRLEQLPLDLQIQLLVKACNYYETIGIRPILCQKIMSICESQPELLNLDVVQTLYDQNESQEMLAWLQERWQTIVYLCQIVEMKYAFRLLRGWDTLRTEVFEDNPSIISEYNFVKQSVATSGRKRQNLVVNYQSSSIWQELNAWYLNALNGDKLAFSNIVRVVYHEPHLSKRAVATHLLGKLKNHFDVRPALFHAIRYAPDDVKYEELAMNASVRFEAGEALRDIPLPDVWEVMVDAFFIRPQNVLDSFICSWIGYLTDCLSGIDKPYSGNKWGDEESRFWFHDIVDEK